MNYYAEALRERAKLPARPTKTDRTAVARACSSVLTKAYETHPEAAHRALQFLQTYQTWDEDRDHVSRHRNDVGFSEPDAPEGARLAKEERLAGRDVSAAKRMARKYGTQIAENASDQELKLIITGPDVQPSPVLRSSAPRRGSKVVEESDEGDSEEEEPEESEDDDDQAAEEDRPTKKRRCNVEQVSVFC